MTVHQHRAAHHPSVLGGHEPELVVAPGDTIVTQTVDSYGGDPRGVQVAEGDNPLTGPFAVEGAEPGDALVVHIRRLAANRVEGYSEAPVIAGAVDPEYVRELPPRTRVTWAVDGGSGKASLVEPGAQPITVPLRPMLGCIGVAPREQVLWSGTSGPHGGNMDYRGVVAGATIYLPVATPGAMLYVGDGHAAQGAGEIGGAGIEVSMDVELAVDLRKGAGMGWPRGEDAASTWTLGNARPLHQALQHATTEMLRWLQQDFDFDLRTASILLSQAADYEVGNVCDPAFTMVCKLPKSLGFDRRAARAGR